MLLRRTAGRERAGAGRFRRWRRSRPFWGGFFAILAGAEICVLPLAPLKVMLQQGVAGIPSVLMGIIMIVLGLTAWFAPPQRGPAGVLTTLIATAALVMSNLGGFLIGTLLGILGGGLMFAWQPYAAPRAGGAKPGGSTPPPATSAASAPASTAAPASASAPASAPTAHHDPQGAQP
ncbi:DUF6114 domain-containing protein [Streptomyces sp. NBC_01408]|uniref:DUF6114 domain-containing protein n=1 Tax=Streptomyces sp. NBC_01408 TaxID=2903855 RepID=UPI00224D1B58|nr:DUF6114 domain-containing protein [Streptomyces sp. NBC_01408]MCX4695547.1 DUF6114 domain-containing protein [Streptomyces sp. NBC_01408]